MIFLHPWFWMKELLHSQASSSLSPLIRNNSTLPYNNTTYLLPYSLAPYSINCPSHSLPSVRLILYSIGCNCLARLGRATWSKITFARLKSCDRNEIRLSWWVSERWRISLWYLILFSSYFARRALQAWDPPSTLANQFYKYNAE